MQFVFCGNTITEGSIEMDSAINDRRRGVFRGIFGLSATGLLGIASASESGDDRVQYTELSDNAQNAFDRALNTESVRREVREFPDQLYLNEIAIENNGKYRIETENDYETPFRTVSSTVIDNTDEDVTPLPDDVSERIKNAITNGGFSRPYSTVPEIILETHYIEIENEIYELSHRVENIFDVTLTVS